MSERLLSEIQKLPITYPHNDQMLLISALVQELTNHLEGLDLRIQKQKEVILKLQEQVETAERKRNELDLLCDERSEFILNGVKMGFIQLPLIDEDKANKIHSRCLLSNELAANQLRQQNKKI